MKKLTISFYLGLSLFVVLILFVYATRFFYDTSLVAIGSKMPYLPPSSNELLGSDSFGRDMLASILIGTPLTFQVGILGGSIGLFIGATLGLISGYFGGKIDNFIRVISDSLVTIPSIAILLVAALNIENLTRLSLAVIVAGLSWMYPARTIRAQVLSLKNKDFIKICRANGQGEINILFRDVMPNLMPYLASTYVLSVFTTMIATVGLESLGLGVEGDYSLGTILYWSQRKAAVVTGTWWWYAPPILMLTLIFLALLFMSIGLDKVARPSDSAKV